MKRLNPRLISALICSLLMFSSAHAANKHPLTGETLAEEQVFTYRLLDESPTIDPQLIEDVSGSAMARDFYEGLLTQKADGTLAPGVALRWESNEEKNIYTFYLRDNAKWSNGDPVTAHDFAYAWRRLVDPATASEYATYLDLMAVKNAAEIVTGKKPPSELGVRAIDDLTFEVTLDASIPYLPAMVVHTSVMPANQKVIEKFGKEWTKAENFVGNGAYVLKEWILNERMVRVRNPLYWNNDSTIIDKVVALVINDENQAYNRYQAGEVDRTEVPSGQYPRLEKALPDEAHSDPRLCSYYYLVNTLKKPFDDIRIRKALSYAINRDVIVNNILKAGQIPAFSFTPGSTANFTVPEIAISKVSQKERVNLAKQLLADAGYGPGKPLKVTILYNTSEGHKKIAIAIRQMWKAIGVETTLENQEWKTYLTTRHEGNFEVARAAWCGDYNEASTFLDLVRSDSEHNDGKYNNPQVDRLLDEAHTMSDPNPNYKKIEEIITEEYPILPIYHYTNVFMLKTRVKGWPHQNVENNWYSKDLYIVAE